MPLPGGVRHWLRARVGLRPPSGRGAERACRARRRCPCDARRAVPLATDSSRRRRGHGHAPLTVSISRHSRAPRCSAVKAMGADKLLLLSAVDERGERGTTVA